MSTRAPYYSMDGPWVLIPANRKVVMEGTDGKLYIAQGCEQCENKTCAQQFGDADITKCRNCSEHNIPCTPVIPDTPLPATHPSIVLVQLLNDISKLYYDDYGNQFSNTHPMWEYSTKLLAYFLHVKCTYEFLQVKAPPMPDVVPGEDGNRLWLPQRANTQRDD